MASPRPSHPAKALGLMMRPAVLALLLLACPGSAEAAPEGTVTWGVHASLVARWLDPAETEGTIIPFMMLYALHDALLKPMPSGLQTPSLAESWTMSKDGLAYEFVLRKGVKFHNGEVVTADDVKFSFERYRGAGAKQIKDKVREVQVVDPGRVRFHLKEPWPDFLTYYGTTSAGAGRIVSRSTGNGVFWIDLPDQWDPKSPWHDRRVRLAASLALDRQAVNQAESLGTSRLTGSIVPRSFEFALPLDPPPYDPGKARQLLAEAGYPHGFDAGDFYPYPPLFAMGEALSGYLGAVGIRTRIRTMERAAFLTAWREKRLKGVVMGLNGSGGNAATRLEAYVTTTGIFAYGVLPEVEDLFQRQAREIDRTKREALLHQIQRILHERVMHVPIYELSPMAGVSARVEQAGVGLIPGYPYSAPYEDLQLKKP